MQLISVKVSGVWTVGKTALGKNFAYILYLIQCNYCVIGWMAVVRFPLGQDLFLRHDVQVGSGAYPTFYPVNAGVLFWWLNLPEPESDHLPPANA